ncbi:hypothetical protein CONPUDRAFT_140383 [Coniophora puteana RWD-64-598 SS2]|uniref:Probable methionine--tRNA ligase, mitochondrial n=1 Tax=Coniophora puteana (strain RWD-64-598) TaxID=741705 RepID=R7SFN4_CONPW|nr:uncharacterized protein CONPUDRAFT_140383 [Coniophora puteana RWD-64-598 SS2]EIW74547.1 hypothetical protein CONPUDRAFT_140383 [Coniophora puteana RWD-64-598 SS2]
MELQSQGVVSKEFSGAQTKPYYVTTPIFYPNAVPHIGHLYTLVTGDILARHARIAHPDRVVKFLTGTDEHGLKIQKVAAERGVRPMALCDRLSGQFRRLAGSANVSGTVFMRTTSAEHRRAVEHVWKQLDAKGLIYKDAYEGWYSVSDECFYTHSQVHKTTLPSGEEITVSTETGSTVEWSQEENYKFRLSAFRETLLEHYTRDKGSIFPSSYHEYLVDLLKNNDLDDLSVSRPRTRLEWGVPVPGDPEHTIYVWFDALTVYLSGIGFPWAGGAAEGSGAGWAPDVQVIGKDILRFHAIYLPAMLKALELPLSRTILTHAHWTVNQRKMSKSVGNVVDPFEAMEIYGVDVVRFYLARVGGRFRDDVDWSTEQLDKHSDELRNLLGNLFMRITSKAIRARVAKADEKLDVKALLSDTEKAKALGVDLELLNSVGALGATVRKNFDMLELGDALEAIMLVLRQANATMTNSAPWAQDPQPAAASYVSVLETIRVCALCLQPFIPEAAQRLLDAMDVRESERTLGYAEVGVGAVGEKVEGVKLFNIPQVKV